MLETTRLLPLAAAFDSLVMGAGDAANETNEAQVVAMLNRSPFGEKFRRWVSVGGTGCGVRLNWVTTFFASFITWGFALLTIADRDNAVAYFASGKLWVSTNFTWLYICARAPDSLPLMVLINHV